MIARTTFHKLDSNMSGFFCSSVHIFLYSTEKSFEWRELGGQWTLRQWTVHVLKITHLLMVNNWLMGRRIFSHYFFSILFSFHMQFDGRAMHSVNRSAKLFNVINNGSGFCFLFNIVNELKLKAHFQTLTVGTENAHYEYSIELKCGSSPK